MTLHYSLLDVLAHKLGDLFLSDLLFLDRKQMLQLLALLECADETSVPLSEWNDALSYLAELPPEPTSTEAKARLIAWLKKKTAE